MAQLSQRLVLKVMTMTVALSTLGLANAHADIDPAICGIGGGVVGGLAGHQFGGGRGNTAMTILGAVAGVVAGNAVCQQADNSDVRVARQNERQMLMNGGDDSYEWSNPRYGRQQNSHSHIERRGYYGQRECTMTRSIMQSNDGGRYVNESYWCNDGGNWNQITETNTIRQIQWGANGPVQTTTTETTTTYQGGRPPMPPPQMQPNWIVGENRVQRFQIDLKRSWPNFESGAADIASDLSRSQQFITLDQLGRILGGLSFDSERDQVLPTLAPFVDQQFGSMESVTRVYTFASNRGEARRLLDEVQRDKQNGPRRDGRGGYDRGDRPDFGRDRRDDRRPDWRRP